MTLPNKYFKDGELKEQLQVTELSDEDLRTALGENKISMTVDEARHLPGILGRNPTLTEAILWGIQGSEHCSYRSSRKFLKDLPTSGPTVMLGPSEDSGVVKFATVDGKDYGIIMSHESHNHPSQVVPYEGAATGVGGIIRDILCMGGRPIAIADPLRFGDIDRNHTKTIANDVVSGISGYGNPIGVPNLAGDVYFNDSFDDNCLVNVVALGVLSRDELIHSFVPEEAAREKYDIIIVGKPTDNSGMGGAAFASADLKEEDKEANKGAVQEPNPFLKRHIIESTCDLFKTLKETGNLDKIGFKDMGAGGNVCASVEQVERVGLGAEVDIAKVHTSMEGLHPSVIALSETQERLCWMCHPSLTQMILDHYNVKWDLPKASKGAKASLVGKVKEGNYVLKCGDQILVDAKPSDITEGIRSERAYSEPKREFIEPEFKAPLSKMSSNNIRTEGELTDVFLNILSSENICSRRPIYENYDKVVQGQTVIQSGEADAGVMAPLRNRSEFMTRDSDGKSVYHDATRIGISLTVDSNPRQSRISPYWSAANAVCEGVRNTAAVGASPIAFTDCLNYGNPEKPEQMWEFTEGVRGIAEAAKAIPLKDYPNDCLPCVSGNVSFYNESPNGPVDASAVIGTLGRMDDAFKAVTMQLKNSGSLLYMIGERKDELGASEYYQQLGQLRDKSPWLGANVPKADFKKVAEESYALTDLIDQELVLASHDISDGGLAVAIAEMALGGNADGQLGVEVSLDENDLRFDKYIFSETGGFVIEVDPTHQEVVETLLNDRNIFFTQLGGTLDDPYFVLKTEKGDEEGEMISLPLEDMAIAWGSSLRKKLK
ncbi:MAG: phosphoribosylformylglycinamidine synthase subunit PurL [Candidatus Peregrinibacteria bacterium]|nr:phosphoribosylformylglycinamidine synthase subunit PurL [Candidatus Peregrinibacteria bacterium]MDZ4244701.1 phosphoribosylformylglycinamidine synthase subunit PurL [Candidatus Gracilibacteria bacterium]